MRPGRCAASSTCTSTSATCASATGWTRRWKATRRFGSSPPSPAANRSSLIGAGYHRAKPGFACLAPLAAGCRACLLCERRPRNDLADRDHALDRPAGALGDLGLNGDDVLPVAERVAQLLERDHLHVLADRPLRDGLEALSRRLLVQPVENPGLGRYEEAVLVRALGEVDHPLGRENVRALVAEGHALAGAAALGVDEQLGVRRLTLPALDVRRADAGVNVALPHPDIQLAPRHPLQPDA